MRQCLIDEVVVADEMAQETLELLFCTDMQQDQFRGRIMDDAFVVKGVASESCQTPAVEFAEGGFCIRQIGGSRFDHGVHTLPVVEEALRGGIGFRPEKGFFHGTGCQRQGGSEKRNQVVEWTSHGLT